MAVADAPLGTHPAFHDVEFYLGDPHAAYRWLRAHDPVHRFEPPRAAAGRAGSAIWMLTRWADIRLASKRSGRFTTSRGVLLNDRLANAGMKRASYLPKTESIIHMDPPKHGRVRNLVSSVFTPRRVAALEPWMRALCREHFDALPTDAPVDLVAEIAAPLPAITMARILGVPPEQWRHFQDCANAMIEVAAGDPADTGAMARHGAKLGELAESLRERIADRRATPRDDLLSDLVHARVPGLAFDDADVLLMAITLLGAGNETTRTLVARSALALAEHPDERAKLTADPALLPGAIEELLRFTTPVHSHARTALADVELRGRRIREGDYLVLLYASGNRDEEVWADGDVLDVARPVERNPHLSFGHGEHFCIGAHLARLEARVVLGELLARFPRYALAGEPRFQRSTHINGIEEMPVVLGGR